MLRTAMVVYGKPGLVSIARLNMFEQTVDGGINLSGVSIGGMCLTLPKDDITNVLYSIRLSGGTSHALEILGYGSRVLLNEVTNPDVSCLVAGQEMSRQRGKGRFEEYRIEVESF